MDQPHAHPRLRDHGRRRGLVGFLLGMLAVTLVGIFVISTLIGIITSGIEGKLASLRKGRSRVLERGHTLILGWSPQVFTIVSELVTANANQAKGAIVILADQDKVEMEDEIRERVPDTGRTTVVCRTGIPIDIDDLEIVRLETSRAIIILSPETDDPDADVIKTMLAITNHPRRRPEPYHIVAELHDPGNLEVARLVGGTEAQLVLAGDLIARIIAQTCRQSGLSVVYTELLDFDGDEIYFTALPELAGPRSATRCSPTRIRRSSACGPPAARPSSTRRWTRSSRPATRSSHLRGRRHGAARERPAGVRRDGHPAGPAGPGLRRADPDPRLEPARADHHPRARQLRRRRAPRRSSSRTSPTRTPALVDLRPTLANRRSGSSGPTRPIAPCSTALDVPSFDHVIVLCYADGSRPQRADARTLVTLLHLRDIASERSGRLLDRQSEMLDLRNRALAEVTRADDFIVSDAAGQPDDGPGLRERGPERGLRRPVRPGRLGDLPAPGHRLRRARGGGHLRDRRRFGSAARRGRHRLSAGRRPGRGGRWPGRRRDQPAEVRAPDAR